jgi:hypothetical protein
MLGALRWRRLSRVIACGVLVASCGDDETGIWAWPTGDAGTGGKTNNSDGGSSPECQVDSDCKGLLELCQSGACVAQSCSLTQAEIETKCGSSGRACLVLTNYDCADQRCVFSQPDCDDGDPCTRDACFESAGGCQHDLDPPMSSETGSYCTNGIDDDCDGIMDNQEASCGGCTTDLDCDDGSPCTDDKCASNACTHTPVAAVTTCDDADDCTVLDHCDAGSCVGSPRDDDKDGHGSVACGGDDCDDAVPERFPGNPEEPGATCTDGVDNDCDDAIDRLDASCHPICLRGMCWTMPLMHGWTIEDSFARPGGDLWQVGAEGVTLRWNGTTWTAHDSGSTNALHGVWAVGSSAWAVGNEGTVVHWTGSAWSPITAPAAGNLISVSGASDTEVWVGGLSGAVYRWTGSIWEDKALGGTNSVNSLIVVASNDVWAGTSAALSHYNGVQWADAGLGTGVTDLVKAAAGDYWATTSGSTFHYTGGAWASDALAPTDGRRAWANAANDVWIVTESGNAHHFDGANWTRIGSVGKEIVVGASLKDEIWFGGRNGRLLLWDGTALHTLGESPSPGLNDERKILSVVALSDTEAWATGEYGALFEWNGSSWTQMPKNQHAQNSLDVEDGNFDMWPKSKTELYLVGGNQYPGRGYSNGFLEKWDGTKWSTLASRNDVDLKGVWGPAANDLFVAASGRSASAALHWNGTAFTDLTGATLPFGLFDVAGSSAKDVWFIGSDGVVHYDGTSLTTVTLPCGPLGIKGIAVGGPGDVWIAAQTVGTTTCATSGGIVFHKAGAAAAFTVARAAPNVGLVEDLWLAAPGDVWVVDDVDLHHLAGGAWSSVARGGLAFNGLSGPPGGKPWGFSAPRRILHAQ